MQTNGSSKERRRASFLRLDAPTNTPSGKAVANIQRKNLVAERSLKAWGGLLAETITVVVAGLAGVGLPNGTEKLHAISLGAEQAKVTMPSNPLVTFTVAQTDDDVPGERVIVVWLMEPL